MTSVGAGPLHHARLAKLSYATLFVIVLPLALIVWALRLDELLTLPAVRWPAAGFAIAAFGLTLMLDAMLVLWHDGHGLPASAFPPQRLVTSGPYRLFAHPIYVGAVLLCLGGSVASGSAGGLLVVTPTLAGAEIAWVLGFERDFTARRLGSRTRPLIARVLPTRLLSRAAAGAVSPFILLAERIANSWREWTIGPVRIMNHGIYAGVGAAMGVGVAAAMAGSAQVAWLVAFTLAAIAGAGAWAQLVEGSPQLLRPYGYFGSVLAVVMLAVIASLAGADVWLALAAFCVGSTVTYAAGRMRCLVQGCCHGAPTSGRLGIIYRHPRSRVVRLSAWAGIPVHATPMHSALWMLLVGAMLMWLWLAAAPLSFIVGSYFILVGLGRFVEEHFRGEPQTLVIGGMRLYQWLSIGLVAGGAATTMLSSPAAAPARGAGVIGLLPALAGVAAFACIAYGVDFPGSSRRLSRLV